MKELSVDGFCYILINNNLKKGFLKNDVDASLIQFHFVLKGSVMEIMS